MEVIALISCAPGCEARAGSRDLTHEGVLQRLTQGISEISVTPDAASSATISCGGRSRDSSMAKRSSAIGVSFETRGLRRSIVSEVTPLTTSSQPFTSKATISLNDPDESRRPAARIATRLHSASASVRMCELKKTVALVAKRQDQVAHLAPSERIEPRHRLVEKHDFRVVDERLGDADALQHALRELAKLQPPFGADATRPADAARDCRRSRRRVPKSRRSSPAALRRSGSRRSTDSREGSRSPLHAASPTGRPRMCACPRSGNTSCISSFSVVRLAGAVRSEEAEDLPG